MKSTYPATALGRHPERGSHEADLVRRIIDDSLLAHVGFQADGGPYVIPMAFARLGDKVYFHCSTRSRIAEIFRSSSPVCATFTLLDGLVLARSVFHHSMNYRSAMVMGESHEVTDAEEKGRALDALVQQIIPGRLGEVRGPSEQELSATCVAAVSLKHASAKVREGGPKDAPSDMQIRAWAGVIPLSLEAGAPQADEQSARDCSLPRYISEYRTSGRGETSEN